MEKDFNIVGKFVNKIENVLYFEGEDSFLAEFKISGKEKKLVDKLNGKYVMLRLDVVSEKEARDQISKNEGNYASVPGLYRDRSRTPIKKREEVIKIALSGGKRPRGKLGAYIVNAVCKTSRTYDKEFDSEIRSLRPDWFDQKDTHKKNKDLLLNLAKSSAEIQGKYRGLLSNYVKKGRRNYDSTFREEIEKVRPYWITATTEEKKENLLAIASKGDPKPEYNTTLGWCLTSYIGERSLSFDKEFYTKIKEIRPEWIPKRRKV